MLTIPAEVNSERHKVSTKPVLLVEFPNLGVRYGSKLYTIDNAGTPETYDERLLQKSMPSFTLSLRETINGLISAGRITLKLTDWQGQTRTEIFTAGGDIRNEPVNVYLKYDTGVTSKSNALKLYEGRVEDYTVERNVLTLKIRPDTELLESEVLEISSEYKNTPLPIQYGDFSWNDDGEGLYYAEVERQYAQITPVAIDGGKVVYLIANHELHTFQQNINGGILFYVRDSRWCNFKISTNLWANTPPVKLDVTFDGTEYGEMRLAPTEAGASNLNANWQNAVDGKSSTLATVVADGSSDLAVTKPGFSNLKEARVKQGAVNNVTFRALIEFGAITANLFEVEITDGTNSVVYPITTTDASSRKYFDFPQQAVSFGGADNYQIIVRWDTSFSSTSLCEVKQIQVVGFIQPPDKEEPIYLRCIGKKFPDTWGGRKNTTDYIDTPAEMIEDLLRSAGFTAIRTADFDAVHSVLNAMGIRVAASITDQIKLKELLDEIGKTTYLGITYASGGWRLTHPFKNHLNFTVSGTGTPNNDDIFTDKPGVSGDAFSQHPVLKPTFSRTAVPFTKVAINYMKADNKYLSEVTSGTGTKVKRIKNPYIRKKESAQALADAILYLYNTQRFRVVFETFWNAIPLEPGDIINVRSQELDDSVTLVSVNSDRWQVVEIQAKFRPHKVKIKALEIG